MNAFVNTTIKSTFVSIGLHASVIILGSMAIYKSPMKSLELSGAGGKAIINLSSFNISGKKLQSLSRKVETTKVQTVTTTASAIKHSVGVPAVGSKDTSAMMASTASGSATEAIGGTGNGSGSGNGNDFDQGKLFGQIRVFFENRLGSTLNINIEQLVKIKIVLNSEGEILSAEIVQGKLEFQSTKKILSVARNIPLKAFWKSSAPYPQELIIPLILTPS